MSHRMNYHAALPAGTKALGAVHGYVRQSGLPSRLVALGTVNEEQLRDELAAALRSRGSADPEVIRHLVSRVHFVPGDFDSEGSWQRLGLLLSELDQRFGTGGNYLFYLAITPTLFLPVVRRIASTGLANQENGQWRRIIVEKPFGTDLQSAKQLNRNLLDVVCDDQILRIDHYLGKETVQNILIFRFANGIFEPIWDRRYVDHVQITVAETVGTSRCLLRPNRCTAGYAAKSRGAVACAHRDGAAKFVFGTGAAKRAGEGAASGATNTPGSLCPVCDTGTIHAR